MAKCVPKLRGPYWSCLRKLEGHWAPFALNLTVDTNHDDLDVIDGVISHMERQVILHLWNQWSWEVPEKS